MGVATRRVAETDAAAPPAATVTLETGARVALVTLAVLALIAALAVARVFVVPVILACLLALVFSPVCRVLRRRGIPDALSALFIVLGLLAGFATTTVALAIPATGWLEDAPAIAREAEAKLRTLAGYAEAVSEAGRQLEEVVGQAAGGAEPVEVVLSDEGPITTVALGAPVVVAQTLFVLILMYFILASGSLFHARLIEAMPTFGDKRRALEIAYDIEREVSRYLLAITAINAGLGLCVGLAMWALQMPNPIAFAILAFALNYVPFLGALAGVAISFAVALVALPTGFDAFVVGGVYLLLTSVEGQVVTPWIVGRHLRINTVVILVAVAFWAWLWSVMGMMMAVPLLVCLHVVCRHVPPLSRIGSFLSGPDADAGTGANGTDDTEPSAPTGAPRRAEG